MSEATLTMLAADLGATSGRVMAGVLADGRLKIHECHRFPNRIVQRGNHMCWDLQKLFASVREGIARACHEGLTPRSIGVDSWGNDFGLIDRSGTIIGQPVAYRDLRTRGMREWVEARLGREALYRLTGIQCMPYNALYHLASMVKSESIELDQAWRLLMIPDLMHHLLCGSTTGEVTNASTTELLDARQRKWSIEICAAIGIPPALLPPLLQPGERLGQVEGTTLGNGSPIQVILPATHDTASAVAAIPATGQDWAFVSLGTWALVGFESSAPYLGPAALEMNVTNEAGLEGSYRILKNVTGMWLLEECLREWQSMGLTVCVEELVQAASHERQFMTYIDPDHESLAAPERMVEAIRSLASPRVRATLGRPSAVVRVILDSVTTKCTLALRNLEKLRGSRFERLHVVGGGSKNALICQSFADACNCTVLAGPAECTVMGNLLVQAMAWGVCHDRAHLRRITRHSCETVTYEPKTGNRKGWQLLLDQASAV